MGYGMDHTHYSRAVPSTLVSLLSHENPATGLKNGESYSHGSGTTDAGDLPTQRMDIL
jgi:hypothetical protein